MAALVEIERNKAATAVLPLRSVVADIVSDSHEIAALALNPRDSKYRGLPPQFPIVEFPDRVVGSRKNRQGAVLYLSGR